MILLASVVTSLVLPVVVVQVVREPHAQFCVPLGFTELLILLVYRLASNLC